MRRMLLLVGGLALAVTLAAPAGAGQTERVETKVTLKDNCPDPGIVTCRTVARRNYTAEFFGRVRSDVASCERRRTVKLIRTAEIKTRRRGSTVVGTTKSDSDGRWEIVFGPGEKQQAGTYLAKATRKRKGDVVCKPDKSPPEEHQLIYE